MNYDRLEEHAQHLEKVARQYAMQDPEAAPFYDAIQPWMAETHAELISEPVEPREFLMRGFFDEGNLRKCPEPELAFSMFAVEAMDQTAAVRAVERMLSNRRQ